MANFEYLVWNHTFTTLSLDLSVPGPGPGCPPMQGVCMYYYVDIRMYMCVVLQNTLWALFLSFFWHCSLFSCVVSITFLFHFFIVVVVCFFRKPCLFFHCFLPFSKLPYVSLPFPHAWLPCPYRFQYVCLPLPSPFPYRFHQRFLYVSSQHKETIQNCHGVSCDKKYICMFVCMSMRISLFLISPHSHTEDFYFSAQPHMDANSLWEQLGWEVFVVWPSSAR
jgi:hypothetical protein